MKVLLSEIIIYYICPECKQVLTVTFPFITDRIDRITNRVDDHHTCAKCVGHPILFPMKVTCELHKEARLVDVNIKCDDCGSEWSEEKVIYYNKAQGGIADLRKEILNEQCINPQCEGAHKTIKSTIY